MKRFAFFFLLLALFVLANPVFAAVIEIEAENYSAYGGAENIQNVAEASAGQIYGMKPADEFTAQETWVSHDFTVDAAGTYAVEVHYSASGNRFAEMFMDNTPVDYITFADTGAWTTFSSFVREVELGAGSHTLKFQAPSDYNNDTIKTPNLDKFVISFVEAAETEAPEPVTEPAPPEAVTTPAAPQTSDIAFGVVALMVIAGIAVRRKSR